MVLVAFSTGINILSLPVYGVPNARCELEVEEISAKGWGGAADLFEGTNEAALGVHAPVLRVEHGEGFEVFRVGGEGGGGRHQHGVFDPAVRIVHPFFRPLSAEAKMTPATPGEVHPYLHGVDNNPLHRFVEDDACRHGVTGKLGGRVVGVEVAPGEGLGGGLVVDDPTPGGGIHHPIEVPAVACADAVDLEVEIEGEGEFHRVEFFAQEGCVEVWLEGEVLGVPDEGAEAIPEVLVGRFGFPVGEGFLVPRGAEQGLKAQDLGLGVPSGELFEVVLLHGAVEEGSEDEVVGLVEWAVVADVGVEVSSRAPEVSAEAG